MLMAVKWRTPCVELSSAWKMDNPSRTISALFFLCRHLKIWIVNKVKKCANDFRSMRADEKCEVSSGGNLLVLGCIYRFREKWLKFWIDFFHINLKNTILWFCHDTVMIRTEPYKTCVEMFLMIYLQLITF